MTRNVTHTVRVGVPQSDYNVKRNILGSLPSWARRCRPVDRSRLQSALRWRITGRQRHVEQFRFSEPYLPRVDMLHFFNTVADVATPWWCTFETSLPRWGDVSEGQRRHGFRLMLRDSCQGLLALSDAARAIASSEWSRMTRAADVDVLLSKTEVVLPPQPVICTVDEKPVPDAATFVFVGRDFFRKGGLEFLAALYRLHGRGIREWKALIVGRLDSYGDYASETGPDDMAEAQRLLGRLATHVTHQSSADNRTVVNLLRSATFFVFPTLAETFGYSVLEAQACGAVVISTNVRALPEINDSTSGFVLELPLDERREAHGAGRMRAVKESLVAQLETAIERAISMSTDTRRRLADAATRRLIANHDPGVHAARMAHRYQGVASR